MNILQWLYERKNDEHIRHEGDHTDALHAEARAIEDKRKSETQWLDWLVLKAHLEHMNEANHFGERLTLALQQRRTKK